MVFVFFSGGMNEVQRGLQRGHGYENVVVTFRATANNECAQVTVERAGGVLPVIELEVPSTEFACATVVAWVRRCSDELPSTGSAGGTLARWAPVGESKAPLTSWLRCSGGSGSGPGSEAAVETLVYFSSACGGSRWTSWYCDKPSYPPR